MARDLVVRYEGDTSGADAASAKTRAQLAQTGRAADQMSKQFEAAAKRASASGAGIGNGLAKGIARAAGNTLLKSAGNAAGTAITNAIGRQIAQTNVWKGLQAKAGIGGQQAGQKAGAKVASGIEKTSSSIPWSRILTGRNLAIAGVAAGLLFGSRFGRSASERAQSSFRPSFTGGGGGGGLLGKAIGGLKFGALGVAAGVGTSIAGALTGAIALGANRLISIDDATAKLRGLGHSARDVSTIMGSALAAVKGTAFGLGDAATVAASSVAAGIKPGKDLERTLRLVADAATIGGSSLVDMGGIFNKVATSNKVYNDTLQQLGDQGIPIVKDLAKQMGVSGAEVTKLASKGKIDFKTFRAALEDGLGGAALASGNTFTGALANAKAALGRFGAGLLKGAFPQLKRVFGDVTQALDSATPAATRIGGAIGRVFSSILTTVEGSAPIIGQLGPLLEGVGRIAAAAFGPAVGSGLKAYAGNITKLIDFLATHQETVIKGLQSGANAALDLGQALVDAGVSGLRGIGALADGVAGFVDSGTAAIGQIVHSAAAIAPLLGPAGIPILKAAGDFDKAQASAKGVSDALHGAGRGARAAADGLDKAATPALKRTRDRMNEVANQEIFKAKQRDAAAGFAVAVRNVGIDALGSSIHLKKWSDRSDLSAGVQRVLAKNLKSATSALHGQIDAQQAAGAGQSKLTKTWTEGRNKLAAEFRQMGLSKAEAGRLADKYAGIKPKVKTTFSTPGLPQAVDQAQTLRNSLNDIPRNIKIKIAQSVATKGDNLLKNSDKNVMATGGVWLSGPSGGRVVRAAAGRVLPGYSPGRDVHRFYSATAGELDLSGGEAVMRPEWTRAIGGPAEVARQNRAAQNGTLGQALATGGVAALAPALTTPGSATRPQAAAVASADQLKALVDQVVSRIEVQVAVTPDHRGIRGLVQAEVAVAARKRSA